MNTDYVLSRKSKGLSDETITPYATSDNSLIPLIDYCGSEMRVKFTRSYLKQPKISYTHKKGVNIYIVYELGASTSHNNDPTLKNCLSATVILLKTQILINTGILVMELDFIEDQDFHFQVVDLVKMH